MSSRAEAAAPRLRVTARALVLAAIVVVLGIAASVPVRQLVAQRAEIGELERQVQELAADRERLRAEIERLRDPQYLERLARECLGMVRPGEIRFVVPDEEGGAPSRC